MSTNKAHGELHRIPAAASLFKKSVKAMWGDVARGNIGVVRVGKTVYVPQSELDRLIEDGFTPARNA